MAGGICVRWKTSSPALASFVITANVMTFTSSTERTCCSMYFSPSVAPSCFSKVGAKLYGAAVVRLVHANHEVVVVRTVLVGEKLHGGE